VIGLSLVPPERPDSRGRILAAAAALFSERGYASTSLREIASAVDMKAPALYWYFDSKQAILQALLHETLLDFTLAIQAHVVGPGPEDKLRQYIRAYVRKTVAQPGGRFTETLFGVRQMAQFLTPEGQAEIVADQRRHLDILRDALRQGIAGGRFRADLDVTATVFAIFSMCDHVRWWWKPDGPKTAEEIADGYGDLVMRMVVRTNEEPALPRAGEG
jgi:AcrR family transcriptional regulator